MNKLAGRFFADFGRQVYTGAQFSFIFWLIHLLLTASLKALFSNVAVVYLPVFHVLLKRFILTGLAASFALVLAGFLNRRTKDFLEGSRSFIFGFALLGSLSYLIQTDNVIAERLSYHLRLSILTAVWIRPVVCLLISSLFLIPLFKRWNSKDQLTSFVILSVFLQSSLLMVFLMVRLPTLSKLLRFWLLLGVFVSGPVFYLIFKTIISKFRELGYFYPRLRWTVKIAGFALFFFGLVDQSMLLAWASKGHKIKPGVGSELKFFSQKALKLESDDLLITTNVEDSDKNLTAAVKKDDSLCFSYAVKPNYTGTDKINFLVSAALPGGQEISVFSRALDPKAEKKDGGWHRGEISLAKFSGQEITFKFSSEVVGGDGKPVKSAREHALWGARRLGNFSRKPGDYNVILISLDTLRADRVSAGGYFRPTTPNTDKLAKQGVYFKEAITQAPWTLPSHMSVFTGLYPSFHGIVQPMGHDQTELGLGIPTLTELFKQTGYVTQAFTGSAGVAANYGFYRGFDEYVETSGRVEQDTPLLFGKASNWIESHADKKFFLFLHTYGIHAPYVHDYFANQLPADASEQEHLDAVYDSGVLFVDEHVGQLKEKLDRLNLTDKTIIVIFSDHGEDLLHRFALEHGHTLYDELVRVPLIFYGPSVFKPRTVENYQAQLVDIMPTLLEAVGIKSPGKIQGQSLISVLKGGEIPKESYAMSEAISYGPERKAVRHVNQNEKFKYIVTPEEPRIRVGFYPLNPQLLDDNIYQFQYAAWTAFARSCGGKEFYDLVQDPKESNNLISTPSPQLTNLERKIEQYLSRVPKAAAGIPVQIDQNLVERLKSLGYL